MKLLISVDVMQGVGQYISSNAKRLYSQKLIKLCSVKRASLGMAVLCGVMMMPTAAHAQSQGNSSTEILTPLSITNLNDLNFGRIVPGTVRSILRIGRDDGILVVRNGDARPIGGTVERAEFVIVADPLTRVQITLPSTLNIVRVGGTETMRVNHFRIDGRGGIRTRRDIDSSGVLPIFVSAQLRVLPSQAAGIYRANYDVTVEYN